MRRCHNIRLAITRRGMEAWVFAALSSKNSSELSVRSMVDILPLVAGLGSGLTDANDPPVWPVPLDTVHLYCEGSINCLWGGVLVEIEVTVPVGTNSVQIWQIDSKV